MKRTFQLCIACLHFCTIAKSQDTVWLAKFGKESPSKDSAISYDLIYKNKADTQQVRVVRYSVNGTVLFECNYKPYAPKKVLNGPYKIFYEGIIRSERNYKDDKLNGIYNIFWANGRLKKSAAYENGRFVNQNCYTKEGADTTCFEDEIAASFPGGNDSLRRWIFRNFYYPELAYDKGIQGTVQVSFTIAKDGAVEDVSILKSIHPLLDKEAIRLVSKMPKWIPAKQEDRAVKSFLTIPIVFKIPDE
jgi:protein TonB